jgi:Holliday junction DNA helicase RuvA
VITRVTGVLNRVLDEDVRLQVGAFEYQVLVPEFVRRELQTRLGVEVTLHTQQFLEGNQMSNRIIPRLVGFADEAELDFFELFCTVDRVGVRKALKALARPVRDVAEAIQRQDVKWLSTLPGVGKATAEQIANSLHKKVSRYTVGPAAGVDGAAGPVNRIVGTLLDDLYGALSSLGHSPIEARAQIDRLIAGGKEFRTVEEALILIYQGGQQ